MHRKGLRWGIWAAVCAIVYYAFYPPFNIQSTGMWIYLACMAVLWVILAGPEGKKTIVHHIHKGKRSYRKSSEIPVRIYLITVIAAVFSIAWALSALILSPLFLSGTYAARITVTNEDFSSVPAYSFNHTAIIDRDSAENLGDKVMGEMSDLVSQFEVSSEYSQISWQDGTYRVTPLAYQSFIKYLRNRKDGIPGYILVNTTTGSARLQRLEDKMRYVPSAWFNDNLYRRLRFSYPTALFGRPTFEIDDDGRPWYVCSTYGYTGLHALKKVTGVILFDPISGESQKYSLDEVPSWVDRVYPEKLVNTELTDYGKYRKGFWNSLFGQEGVIQPSEGYNYISKDGDVWLYTGMTSSASEDSNIGFMLVNLRTHEAQYIAVSGAGETSVMNSAQGEVLNYGYTATFPTLINIASKPVYLLSLKDSAGLVKMYAMVDAQDYQQVYTVKAGRNTEAALNTLTAQIGGGEGVDTSVLSHVNVVIDEVQNAVIGSKTYIYLKAEGNVYTIEVTADNAAEVLFIHAQDRLTLYYDEEDGRRIVQQIEY